MEASRLQWRLSLFRLPQYMKPRYEAVKFWKPTAVSLTSLDCTQVLADTKNDRLTKEREDMPSFLLNYLIRQVVYFSFLNSYISGHDRPRSVSDFSCRFVSFGHLWVSKVADLRFFRCSLGSRVLQSRICSFPVSTRRQTPTRTPTSLDSSKVSILHDIFWSGLVEAPLQ